MVEGIIRQHPSPHILLLDFCLKIFQKLGKGMQVTQIIAVYFEYLKHGYI